MPKFLWVRNKEHNKTTNKVNHLLSPPPLLKWASFLFTNKWQTLLINHAPIRDGLFANWKFGFDSHPRLHYLQPSCALELIPLSFLNKLSPSSQISPPSNGFKINKPPGLLPSDIHAISYPHCGKGGGLKEPLPRAFHKLQYFETILPSVESLCSFQQDEVHFISGGAAGGLWRHQQWKPSWILPRIRN